MESKLDSKVPKLIFFSKGIFQVRTEEEYGVVIWDFRFLIEKIQQVLFGIVPKGIRIMFLFSFLFFFFFFGGKGKNKVW